MNYVIRITLVQILPAEMTVRTFSTFSFAKEHAVKPTLMVILKDKLLLFFFVCDFALNQRLRFCTTVHWNMSSKV